MSAGLSRSLGQQGEFLRTAGMFPAGRLNTQVYTLLVWIESYQQKKTFSVPTFQGENGEDGVDGIDGEQV